MPFMNNDQARMGGKHVTKTKYKDDNDHARLYSIFYFACFSTVKIKSFLWLFNLNLFNHLFNAEFHRKTYLSGYITHLL